MRHSPKRWLAAIHTACRHRDLSRQVHKLLALGQQDDPDHPAWPYARRYDYEADARRIARSLQKVFRSRALTAAHTAVTFELDPVNLAGEGAINIFVSRTLDPTGSDAELLPAVLRSRVLADLYDWAEDGDAADLLIGLGFTALALTAAIRAHTPADLLRGAPVRRISIVYHDSGVDPLVLGEITPGGFISTARGKRWPAKRKAAKRSRSKRSKTP